MQRLTKIALSVLSLAFIILSVAFLEVKAPRYSLSNSSQSISTFVSSTLGQVSGKLSHLNSTTITTTTTTTDRKYAYATFYSSPANDTRPDDEDKYFTATRVLLYQLLHHPSTKTQHDYPLLILVPNHVDARKTDLLAREGATIIRTDILNPNDTTWIHPARESWAEQFTKLRLFNMTQFSRIGFIDSDMLLIRSLDGMFEEDVVQNPMIPVSSIELKSDEGPLPFDYVFAGVSDAGGPHHDSVPDEHDNVNGGFWVMRPDPVLYAYYLSVMNLQGRFDDSTMEQGLFNYAHRMDGPMPYRHLKTGKWNMNWPSYGDVERGAASVHDKFWDPGNADWIDRQLVEMWWRMQGEMEGFWLRADIVWCDCSL